MKIATPSTVIIEKVAGEMAGVFFDAARSSGLKEVKLQGQRIRLTKYRNNPRNFARQHLEKFIPAAVHALNEILSRDSTPASQKQLIYDALMERVNDKDIDIMAKTAGDVPELEQVIDYKPETEKPKPLILNSDFSFDNKKEIANG